MIVQSIFLKNCENQINKVDCQQNNNDCLTSFTMMFRISDLFSSLQISRRNHNRNWIQDAISKVLSISNLQSLFMIILPVRMFISYLTYCLHQRSTNITKLFHHGLRDWIQDCHQKFFSCDQSRCAWCRCRLTWRNLMNPIQYITRNKCLDQFYLILLQS